MKEELPGETQKLLPAKPTTVEKIQKLREKAELKALRVYVKTIKQVAKRQSDLVMSADKDAASVAAARDIIAAVIARPKPAAVNVNIHNAPTRVISHLGIPEVAVLDGRPLTFVEQVPEPEPKRLKGWNLHGRPFGAKDKKPRGVPKRKVIAAEAVPEKRLPTVPAKPDAVAPEAAGERTLALVAREPRGEPQRLAYPAISPVTKFP